MVEVEAQQRVHVRHQQPGGDAVGVAAQTRPVHHPGRDQAAQAQGEKVHDHRSRPPCRFSVPLVIGKRFEWLEPLIAYSA
jgi:hypothetical protein